MSEAAIPVPTERPCKWCSYRLETPDYSHRWPWSHYRYVVLHDETECQKDWVRKEIQFRIDHAEDGLP